MKKTLSINLANSVYNIDEDAYLVLQNYFNELKDRFETEKDSEEILNDIEARFAELFNQRIRYGMQIITLKEVNEVILIMGNPSDFEKNSTQDEPTNESAEERESPHETNFEKREESTKRPKRLYRDTENRYIGGVCSGISHFLSIDVIYIRIAFIILLLLKVGIIVYLICWLITPEAKTSAQKLEMRGEEPTIENIKNFIKENVERMAEKREKELNSSHAKNIIQKIGDGFIFLTKATLKVFMAIMGGFFGCLGLIILFFILFAIAFSSPFLFSFINTPFTPFGTHLYVEGLNLANLVMYPQFIISTLLFLGIPLGAVTYAIFQKLFHWQKTSVASGWILVGIWLISFLTALYYGIHFGNQIFIGN